MVGDDVDVEVEVGFHLGVEVDVKSTKCSRSDQASNGRPGEGIASLPVCHLLANWRAKKERGRLQALGSFLEY